MSKAANQPQPRQQQQQQQSQTGNDNNGSSGAAPASGASDHTSIVLEYLIKRGYHGAASALRQEIEGTAPSSAQQNQQQQQSQPQPQQQPQPMVAAGRTVTQEQFNARNLGGSGKRGAPSGIREDPTPYRDGLLSLREFVYGSLDIHRPELLPILLPVFVHAYLDLILLGYKDHAELLFTTFASDYALTHSQILSLLAGCQTPHAVVENETAQRWRRERYVVRMTRRGWSLLLGWLQGGANVAANVAASSSSASAGHFSAESVEKGREKVLGIINERVRVDLVNMKTLQAAATGNARAWLAEGGLESELTVDTQADPAAQIASTAASASVVPLKLGPMPSDPKLDREVQRVLATEGQGGFGNNAHDGTAGGLEQSTSVLTDSDLQSGLAPVSLSDLPPYPPSFRTIDVRRQAEKVREARKRIRLGPLPETEADKALVINGKTGSSQAKYALPSVCLFTIHDSGDT